MDRIQNYLTQYDPLSVKQHGDKHHKSINTLVAIAIVLALLGAIFLFVVLVSYRSSEVHTVNSQINEWNRNDMAANLKDIALKAKLMPSVFIGGNYNMDLTEIEEERYEQQLESGLRSELNGYDIAYFLQTPDTHLIFPTLNFIEEEIPVGDSAEFCVHVKVAGK